MLDETAPQVVALWFAADDPGTLARFWAEALRWDVGPVGPDGVDLVPGDGTPFGIRFHPATERRSGPGRYHLDLTTSSPDDQARTVARLLDAGAGRLDVGQRPDEGHVVLADPEGNELCIIEPENRFLGDCGRLGALNGDGTEAVGRFWSEALGWPLIWDQDEETAIRAPGPVGPIIAWGGPPVDPKRGQNRLHLHLAPGTGRDTASTVDRLLALGAARADHPTCGDAWLALTDPDGNELCVAS